jgi:hypothetical protein
MMAFVIEMPKLNQGNTSISIQVGGNPADMLAVIRRSLREMRIHDK